MCKHWGKKQHIKSTLSSLYLQKASYTNLLGSLIIPQVPGFEPQSPTHRQHVLCDHERGSQQSALLKSWNTVQPLPHPLPQPLHTAYQRRVFPFSNWTGNSELIVRSWLLGSGESQIFITLWTHPSPVTSTTTTTIYLSWTLSSLSPSRNRS